MKKPTKSFQVPLEIILKDIKRLVTDKDTKSKRDMGGTSKPLHVHRVEKALQLEEFIDEVDMDLIEITDSDDSVDMSNDLDSLLRGIYKKMWFLL